MFRARSSALIAAIMIFGCASASDGEAERSIAPGPTSVRAQQAPAVEKSAIAIQSAITPPIAASASPLSPSSNDDDDADADVVASGVMSEPQRLIMQGVGLCLERALRKGPGPGGSLALGVTVDIEGAVTQVEMGPGYPASARPCVEGRVKSVRFPREPGAGVRYYRYPINEQPAD